MTMNDALARTMQECGYQPVDRRQPTLEGARIAIDEAGRLRAQNKVLRTEVKQLKALVSVLEIKISDMQERFKVRPSTMASISREVCRKFGVKMHDLRGPSRRQLISRARHEAFWRIRQVKNEAGQPRYSFPEIGRYFCRHHTTVLIGAECHQARLDAGEAS